MSVFRGGSAARVPARLIASMGVGALLFALAVTRGAAQEPLAPLGPLGGMRSTFDADGESVTRPRTPRQPVKKATTDPSSPAMRFGTMVGPSAGKTGFVSTNVKSKAKSKTKGKRCPRPAAAAGSYAGARGRTGSRE
jgi:hypothetical protein